MNRWSWRSSMLVLGDNFELMGSGWILLILLVTYLEETFTGTLSSLLQNRFFRNLGEIDLTLMSTEVHACSAAGRRCDFIKWIHIYLEETFTETPSIPQYIFWRNLGKIEIIFHKVRPEEIMYHWTLELANFHNYVYRTTDV